MHPADAARLGVVDGDVVQVSTSAGAIEAPIRIDRTLRSGVVAMTHGFGNVATHGMRVAQANPGVNVNVLTPSGAGSFDPFSSMSVLTGVPVDIDPVR